MSEMWQPDIADRYWLAVSAVVLEIERYGMVTDDGVLDIACAYSLSADDEDYEMLRDALFDSLTMAKEDHE